MGASAYVGRVGGLAVALGVGMAIATGNGVASASPAEKGSSASETSTSADSSAPAKTSTTESGTKVDTDGAEAKVEVEPTPAAEPEAKATGSEADDADDANVAPPTRKPHKPKNVQIRIAKKPSASLAKKSTVSEAPPTSAVATTATSGDTSDEPPVVQRTMAAPEPVTFTDVAVVALQEVRPKVATAPRPSFVQRTVSNVVSQVLSAVGLGSLASNIPGGPSWSPLGLALLALGARRETEQTLTAARTTSTGTPVAALALVPTAAVASEPATTRTPVAVSGNTQFIEFVTGAGNLNDTQKRFGIGGTDLGIMWDNGITDNPTTAVNEHQVLIAFGDTFSNSFPVRSGIWRMNTLFRSTDTTLSNGMYIPDGIQHDPGMYSGSPMSDPNFSREIIGHPRYAIGPEVTIIPTAAISVPGAGANGATRQYISFMSVRSWDTPGSWTTNYSGIAYSDDNGQNWRSELVPSSSIRTAASGRSTVPYVSGNQNFQQNAFVKPPAGSQEAAEGWVYMYGTPSGRNGTVYVSRVNQYQIMDQTKYQYWNGSSWVANKPSAAKPILPGTTTSFFGFFKSTTYPSAGEMSVQYNPYLKKYVMLYADKNNNVVMRTSNTPQGTWSAPTTLVTSTKVPGLYAPMIHPWSGTENLPQSESQYLYWNLSTWGDYQVRLMRTDLTKV